MGQKSNSYRPLAFLFLVISFTWLPWLSAVIIGKGVDSLLVKALIAIGGLGPTASALMLLYASRNQMLITDYWQRVFDYRLITPKGYLLVLLIFPCSAAVAILISLFFGQSISQFYIVDHLRGNWLMLLPFILFTLLLGPVPEELGWRGYWLDGLLTKFNGLTASLIIGVVWACWHIPLFFIKGYPLQQYANNHVMLFAYFLALFPKAILFTFLHTQTNRSTLAAILFHFMGNFIGTIIEIDMITEFIQTVLLTGLASYLVGAYRHLFFEKLQLHGGG